MLRQEEFGKDTQERCESGIIEKFAKADRPALFPVCGISVVFLIFHNVFVEYHLYSVEKLSYCGFLLKIFQILTMGGGESLGGALWFLICLFEISVLWEILRFSRRYVSDSFFQIGVAVFSILLYCLGAKFYLPRLLNVSFVLFIYYAMGWFCAYHTIEKRFGKTELQWGIFLVAAVLLFLAVKTGITYNDMKNPCGAFAVAVTGIAGAVAAAKILQRSCPLAKIFSVCGVYSFSIMALHFLIFKAVTVISYFCGVVDSGILSNLCPVETLGLGTRILYAVCGVIFPIVLSYCFFRAGRFFPRVMRCLTGQWLYPQKN